MASDLIPSGPFWAESVCALHAALAICERASSPDRIDWGLSAFCGADRERDLLRHISSAERQIGAQTCSSGWTPLLARLFSDTQDAFEAADPDNALLGAWRWNDVKSKFNSLRAYGRLASAGETAVELALQGLGDDGGNPPWGQIIEGERLETLVARMERFKTGSTLTLRSGQWSRRLGVSHADFELEERRKRELAGACEQTLLLARAAESVLSPAICETCAAPAASADRPSFVCPHCESLMKSRGDPSSLPPIALPKPAMALAALAYVPASLRHKAEREERKGQGAPCPSFESLAEELSDIARLALRDFDVNADLGRGVRLAHYRWHKEALLWLDQAGCDWSAPDDFGAIPAERLAAESPEAWALIERRAIAPLGPGRASAPKTL